MKWLCDETRLFSGTISVTQLEFLKGDGEMVSRPRNPFLP
jgi:hypothetical protein